MRELPDEKELLEILEMAKIFDRQMREMGDMITAMEEKYEKRIRESRELRTSKQEV